MGEGVDVEDEDKDEDKDEDEDEDEDEDKDKAVGAGCRQSSSNTDIYFLAGGGSYLFIGASASHAQRSISTQPSQLSIMGPFGG